MKKYCQKNNIIFILFILLSILEISAKKSFIENFDRTVYHAANKNWSISQDSRGIMYFGNDLGLLEYDGIKWKLHKLQKNEVVRAVLATPDDIVFTGGYEEFGKWERGLSGILEYVSLSDSLPENSFHNDDIWRIWHNDNKVYFQSFRSIYIYDGKKITELTDKNILFLNKVYDELWVQQMYSSLFRLIDKEYKKIEGSDIFIGTGIQAILPYGKDQYLIATSSRGLYIYDGKQFTKWDIGQELIDDELNCGILSQDGNYYFGTILNGIYVISPQGKIINHFNSGGLMQNNTVLSLKEDTEGNIWAALDKGITCIRNISNMSFYTDPVGTIGAVYAAAIYADKLFIGTNQGIFYTDKKNLESMTSTSQMKLVPESQGQVWSLTVIDGKLYCGHNRGLKIIGSDLKISSPYEVNTGVFSIVQADDKSILLGTYTSLMIINPNTNEITDLTEIKEPITKVIIDHLDNVWLEHMNKSVYKCHLSSDKKRIESYTYFGSNKENQLPYNMKLFKVGGRAAFLGKNEFYTFNDIENKIESYKVLNTLMKGKENLKQVVNIDKNRFWVISDNILYKIAYNGSAPTIADRIDIYSSNLSLVNGFEQIVPLSESISLICLDNGFILYKNDQTSNNVKLSTPYIKSFGSKNSNGDIEYKDYSEPIKVSYSYNTIKIAFSDQDALSNNLYFQYKIEEIGGWSIPQKVNEIVYERLPKGKYTFWVRAVDRLGNQSEPVECKFEILSPWYQTVWAYILYTFIGIVIALVVWVIILRRYRDVYLKKIRERETKRLRRQNHQLLYQVKEKNAELLSQTSSIIQRNELILKIKNEVDEFHEKYNNKTFTPLFQKINVLLNNNLDAEEDWKTFLIKFEEKHTTFFKHLKTSYPQLTANDLKLCACLKLNLDSKEIASLMNISVRAVENSRYRLRKKLNIASNQNLSDFFLNI